MLEAKGEELISLGSAEQFDDFEIELEMKVPLGSELRIAYRENEGSSDQVEAPQSGSAAAVYGAFEPGEWNRYRLRVSGTRHQLWINNRVVSDTYEGSESREGSISLQLEGSKAQTLAIRGSRIRRL